MSEQHTAPIPRLGLTRAEAAAALGMSVDSFERYVQPTLRMVRVGRMRLIPIDEITRWLDAHAETAIDNDPGRRRGLDGVAW